LNQGGHSFAVAMFARGVSTSFAARASPADVRVRAPPRKRGRVQRAGVANREAAACANPLLVAVRRANTTERDPDGKKSREPTTRYA
jgi:hypothetical protein